VNLGPHPPRLWPEDLGRLHDLWLNLSDTLGCKLHHRDVVGVALRRLQRDLGGAQNAEAIEEIRRELQADGPHEGETGDKTTSSISEAPLVRSAMRLR
jgi:hypothetical protein